jgi:phosphorylcholine metabolism protein LicD
MGNYKRENITLENYLNIYTRIHKVLNDLGIEYWLAFGTLLGYVRGRERIVGDSDLDFGCTSKAMDILEKNKHLIYEQGFQIVEEKMRNRRKWRGIIIYDPNIKNFHIDITEWKYDSKSNRYSFRWYIRLNLPSKIFDVLYKLIERAMKKMNDSKGVQTTNFTRYRKTAILHIISNICFEIDWYFNTKRQLEVNIPFLVSVVYYGIKTNIPAHSQEFCKVNYGKNFMIPDNTYRHNGGCEFIKGVTEDGFQRCWIDD